MAKSAAERMRDKRARDKANISHVGVDIDEEAKRKLIADGHLNPADYQNKVKIAAALKAALKVSAKGPADSGADVVPAGISGEILGKSDISVENPIIQPWPLTKREAREAYCELLGGVELPRELVARATAADLVEARASIIDWIAKLESGDGWRDQTTRFRYERRWHLIRGCPEVVEEFGRPFLEGVIRDRLRAADEAARAEPSLKLPMHLESETVRQLLPAGADPDENEAVLKDAAVDAIRGGIELRKKLVQDQEWVDRINY